MDLILSEDVEYLPVITAVGSFIITLIFLYAPVIHYLLSGWFAKRREILSSFSEENIETYFEVFFSTEAGSGEDPQLLFDRLYHKRFGRRHFLIPGVCLFVISGFVLSFISWTVFDWLDKSHNNQLPFPNVGVASLVGAYMWVLYDFISRAQRRDLSPADLFRASFRFIVAVPLALAITALFKPEAGLAIALLLGAFPTRTLFTISRRVLASQLKFGRIQTESVYELEGLQGIGRAEAERFEDEGITNILQLAYSDPIDLTIRTNFSFSYVVDCCSQALAWLYFQQDLAKMRPFGLRGAQEIYSTISELDEPSPRGRQTKEEIVQQVRECLNIIAEEIKMKPEALEWSLRQIHEDPYTEFLCDVWCTS